MGKRRRTVDEATEPSLSLRVAIVGGGLSGLACALALQSKSCPHISRVTVYERDQHFSDRRQGFGLTLTNNPKGPLAELGLLKECIQRNCPSTCHYVFDPKGKVLGYYGRAFKPAADSTYDSRRVGNLRIPRQDLRRMMLKKLQEGTVQWGHRLTECAELGSHLRLTFSNGHVAEADVVVGADGFNSVIRQIYDAAQGSKRNSKEYLGISVILGLSHLVHPLIDERGFYVLDGVHRLFVMPFQKASSTNPQLTMWQLSFSGLSEAEALELKSSGPAALLDYALERVSDWFPMVADMIRNTKLEEVWCTALYDRNPMAPRKRENESRIVVLGDACHPMSMFKGQGANQAIGDGPLLASWLCRPGLTRHSLATRLRCFEREMLARTAPKVLASREAALRLHSPECVDEPHGIEGLDDITSRKVLEALRTSNIGAHLSGDLDDAVRGIIESTYFVNSEL